MQNTTTCRSIISRSRSPQSVPQCPNVNTNKKHIRIIVTSIETNTNQNWQFHSNRICLWQHSHEKTKILGYALLLASRSHDTRTIQSLLENRSKHRATVYHRNMRSRYIRDKIQLLTLNITSQFKNETSFHCEGVLIQLAQRDPVINETYVTSRHCDRLS